MTTVNLTNIALGGSGSGTVRTFDYGPVDDSNSDFIIVMLVEGAEDSGNPGGPALTGNNVGGRLEYRTGNGPGTTGGIRVNRVTLMSNRPLDSIDWGVFGVAGAPGEYISFISNQGSQSNMSSGSLGTVSWSNLGGLLTVSFDYRSESDGNNMVFGPLGNAVLSTGGGGDGETYIRPGTIHVDGLANYPGVYDVEVDVEDSNGPVDTVAFRILIDPGPAPELDAVLPQTNLVGDVINLQLSATNPQGHTLEYMAEVLPAGLEIDPETGLISGTLTANGNYTVELSVKDEYGQCDTKKLTWSISGGDPFDLTNIQPPALIGLGGTEPGPARELSPQEALLLLNAYNKNEVDGLIDAAINLIRSGVIQDLDTLKKVADSLENRTDAVAYLRGLIQEGGDSFNPSGIYSLFGVSQTATEMPEVGQIPAGSVKAQIAELEGRIPTGGGGLSDQAGETMLVREQSNPGPPTAKNRLDVRSFLSVPSIADVTGWLSAKFSQLSGTRLVELIGVSEGDSHFGTLLNSPISSGKKLVEVINELNSRILANAQGGGGGSVTLDSQTIYGRTLPGSGPGEPLSAGQARSLIQSPSVSEMTNAINAAIDGLVNGSPGALDTLNELAEALGDDPNFAATITNAIAAKFSKTQGDALVSLSGMGAGATHHGLFPNNILLSNAKTRQLIEQLGTAVKNLREGNGSWVGTWATPALNNAITGEGFTSSSCQWRQIQLSKQLVFRGSISRPSGVGIGNGPIVLFEIPLNVFTPRIRPITLWDNANEYRAAWGQVVPITTSLSLVQFVGSGWSGARTILMDTEVAL